MKVIGIIADQTTPKVNVSNEVGYTITGTDYKRGGGTAWCIGNGQVHDAMSISEEVCKTLNCMDDPMKILIVRNYEY